MRVVVQRVRRAQVAIAGECRGKIGPGLLLFLGIGAGDTVAKVAPLAEKIAHLRIFTQKKGIDHPSGNPQFSLIDIAGEALVISQFTLFADTSRGRRPFYGAAASPELAQPLYEEFVRQLSERVKVATGEFGAAMQVELINDGPVTLILDSES